MRRAATLEDYLADPVGCCFAGRTWLHFYPHDTFCGFLIWGHPHEDDVERLARVLRVELTPRATPHVSLVDARRVEGIDAGSFGVLTGYVAKHRAALAELVTQLAIVRPTGLMGAVAAGFYKLLRPPYPSEVFAEPVSALAWLGRSHERGMLDELDAIHDQLSGLTPLLRDLRAILEARLSAIALPDAARELGLSERMLQRRLRDDGTTFQTELNAARIRAAKRLLVDTDRKLGQIAFDVGCASPQHLSVLFRKVEGESPSQFRARHKAPK